MPIEVAPIASPNPNQRFMAAVMANARRPEPLADSLEEPSFKQAMVDSFTRDSLVGSFLTDFVPYHLGQKDLPAEIDPAFDPYKQYGNPEWLNANPHMLDAFLDGDVADIPNQQRFDWFAARMKQDYDIRQRLAAAGTTRNILATIPGQIIDGMVGGLALRGLGLAGKAAQAGEWLKAGGTAAKFGKSAMLGASLNLAQEEALRALNPSRHVDEGQAALWAVGLGAAFGSGAHLIASGKNKLGKWMDPIRARLVSQKIAEDLSDPKFHGLDDVAAADEAMLRNEMKVAKPSETGTATKVTWDTIKPGDKVTIYRGEGADQTKGGDWWSFDRSKAEKYGKVQSVEISTDSLAKIAAQGHGGPDEVWVQGGLQKLIDSGARTPVPPQTTRTTQADIASGVDNVVDPSSASVKPFNPIEYTAEEMRSLADSKLSEEKNAVSSVLGADGEKEWNKLQRQLGSRDQAVADAAQRRISEIESSLSKRDVNKLYGIGETGPSADDLREMADAGEFITAFDENVDTLSTALANVLIKLPDATKDIAKFTASESKALFQLKVAQDVAITKGFDPKELFEKAIKKSASKFSDQADAMYILRQFLRKESESSNPVSSDNLLPGTSVGAATPSETRLRKVSESDTGESGASIVYRRGKPGQYFSESRAYVETSGFKGETRSFKLDPSLKIYDATSDPGLNKISTPEERAALSGDRSSMKSTRDSILKRNGYDGMVFLDEGADGNNYKTTYLIADKSPDLHASTDKTAATPGTSVGAATPSETRLREGEIKRFTVLRTPITKQLMKEVEAHYKGGVEWNEHPQQWAYDAKKALEALDAEAKKYAPADLGPVQNAVVKTLGYVTPANKLAGKDSNPSAFSRLVARTLFDFTLPTQEGWDNPLTNTVNTPAEGLRMVYNGWAAESRLAYDEAFREAWQGKATARLSDGSDVTIGRGSKHEFSRAVQERIFAMHEEGRGQRAPSVVHPAIQKAADTLNEYYRKIGFEGKASGYLNYTTNPALPHFTQQWLTDVVERNKSDFIARLKTQWEKNRRIDYDTGTPIDPETWTTDNKVVNPEKISKGANAGGLTKADREAINAYALDNEMSVNEVTLANLRDEFGQDLLDRYEQELQIYYQKAAESTYDSLTHIDNGHGVLDAMDSIPADVREGRILKIDPTQFVDYLERDAVRLLESYDHMVSGRISTRMAIKRDVKNIDKWYKPLMGRSIAADDYNPQMLIEAINEDFKAKIADERITTDLKDRYQHARDMLIGEKNGLLTSKLAELERRESGRPVGWKLFAERNIIRMPFLAQMGKVTIAAFNDLAGAAFVKRLAPEQVGTVRSILKPFVGAPRRDIQGAYVAVVDAIRGLRGDDLVDFSPNIERARFGHGIGGTVMSAVDTATGWMQKKLVQATGINRWSQGMRRFMAGGIMQDIVVGAKKMHQASILVGRGMKQEEAFAKVGLDIADARRLNRLGINSERATRLLEKIDQHGVDYEGNRVDNTHDGFISPEMNKWWAEDRDLYYTLNNAVNSETLNLVVEPKILSRPLMNNTLLGKLFNQFQGFAMAWGTQLAPLAMQRGGHEIAMYAGLMVGLGAIADALRNELTGRRTIGDTIDMWQKNPAGMVYAAVDRSGMTGWLSRPLGLLEQTPFGIAKNLKNTGLSTQYGRQGPLIDQLGPVFGWSNKVYSGVMAGMYEGGWDRKAKMMLWRATPFNNLWAVEGFNRVSEHMGFGTPIGPSNNYQGTGR